VKSYAKKNSLSSWLEEIMRKSFIYHESCAEKVFIESLFQKNIIYKKLCAQIINFQNYTIAEEETFLKKKLACCQRSLASSATGEHVWIRRPRLGI
jgi:hypothetical protein